MRLAVRGVELTYKRAIGSPRALFRQLAGDFLVQLVIETEDSSSPDFHYVAYLAAEGMVVDNYPRAKVPIVDDNDRASGKAATKVFYQLFPGASKITLGAVGEARPTKSSTKLVLEPPTTRAKPPTLDDLFVELYMDELISYNELLRSTVYILPPVANLD